jgi:hypothetical protein
MTRKVWHDFSELARMLREPAPGSMSKAAARHWAKASDHVSKLEMSRRREFGLTSEDLYPTPKPHSRNSEQKD